jgi:3-carboxy-cis,cis-muconate cycloisomerase
MTGLLADFLGPLLIDDETAGLIGTEADLAAMLAFEVALARSEAEHGLISRAAADRIAEAGADFAPDREALASGALKDGVVTVSLVKQLRDHIGAPESESLHFGATSQDVIDTAMALKLKPVLDLFELRLTAVSALIGNLIDTFGETPLMGRTRMQAAIPIVASDRLAVWKGLVDRAIAELADIRRKVLIVTLAGAAGSSEKFGDRIGAVRTTLAGHLGLQVAAYVPHAARDRIVDLGNWLAKVTGGLGKIGQDVALMAQNEIGEIALGGGGGSSAMPHKQNPVRAEVLVSLARFNAVQLSGLHQSLVHEQERSGAAWTLEWLILPSMLNATGKALIHAAALLGAIQRIGKAG